jgi:hypothetical protein
MSVMAPQSWKKESNSEACPRRSKGGDPTYRGNVAVKAPLATCNGVEDERISARRDAVNLIVPADAREVMVQSC